MDFLEHTIAYRVPPAMAAAALLAFDGSLQIDRTAGELGARTISRPTASSRSTSPTTS